ncbi:molecular chaperone GrpE [Ruminococcus flavefaciens]|uniref:Protein GrpE n=1 Tax=Ruminococcus flavefaciens TaxID=1265 RepID=A0A1H6J6S6_RUMFL|nr:nucleotide exchange factor GrpE [Ruminococcus flavefaciens]SEH57642.1 molecular chaperone GrpE [Ruminococcus flavefaciens]
MEKNENFSEELEEQAGDTAETPDADENTDALDEDDAASEYNDTATQFSDLEDALAEANDKYLRLYAEYDNYRKRTAKEKTETYQNASAQCIEKILPVLDSFERSLEAECSDENFKNGMAMIYNQMKNFLTQMNVTEIEALGAEFDPNVHNAIQQLDGTDYASNHVCSVFQKGYMLGDKLVRPAMVAVAV